jgi:predicted DNA-binding transcriptional regulator YafY
MKKKSTTFPKIKRRPDRDRRVRQNTRIARVLRLLNLIQSAGQWNAAGLAHEMDCSERTIYRDLEVLEFAGIPWYFDQEAQGYRVRSHFQFPTLNLSDDEIVGQVVANQLSGVSGFDVSGGATATTRKLAATSPKRTRELLHDVSQLIHVLDLQLADHSKHHEVISTAQRALLHAHQLKGTYQSPYQEQTVRLTLHGYRLCFIKQAWYLIAREDSGDLPKTYRLARFKSLREIEQPSIVPTDFDLKEFFGNAWAVYRGDELFNVSLKFSPNGAKLVTETKWHHTQRIRRHRDGSATITFKVDGLNEIVYWILGWADRVTVIDPPELKVLAIGKLEQSLQNYVAVR